MSRGSGAIWGLCAVLAAGVAAHAWMLLSEPPTHTTLPIFVPVTLEMERAMRAERGQAAGRGGEEAVLLADALLAVELDPATAAAVAPRIEELRTLRRQLLGARDRRHQLNTSLMSVGVDVAAQLTAEQWADVHMRRDRLRVDGDEAVFERLLEELRAAP